MATRRFDEPEIPKDALRDETVAVVGYGNQGRAHALNLRDSGVRVIVGARPGSASGEEARASGFEVGTAAEVTKRADLIMLTTPDVPMAEIFREGVRPNLRAGQMVLFAHGFNVHFGRIPLVEGVDFGLVSPKGPGAGLRRLYEQGSGLPGLVAVAQDATGRAWDRVLAYAWGCGCRKGLYETSFQEETESDLFGEQAVLCGGIPELVKAGFETLVAAGFSPEVAYFECLHETKLIVDLMVERGLAAMRLAISDTAEWGGFVTGPSVINEESRAAMRETLKRIQSGEFAKDWIAECENGQPNLKKYRKVEAELSVEQVGAPIRESMRG
ncbi:MAG: ketol-acid reductoisomerase [Armatimonadetes bacterium]|nr:ketol-acid reductoisomerase [Armatimonadota bacterium]